MSIKAIIRQPVPDSPLHSGRVVWTSDRLLKCLPGTRFPVVMEHNPDECVQVCEDVLLPFPEFLERQPAGQYWILANRRLIKSGVQQCFIKIPWSVSVGWPPFRFESEGELFHYMKQYNLSFREFSIVKVSPMTRPSWL